MSNDKAVELTQALARGPFAQVVEVHENSRTIAMPSDECVALAATLIDAALAKARLEGAKAMQEAAGGLGKHMVNLLPFSIPGVSSPLYKIAENNITTYSKFITSLDPQQVIQEKA